MAAGALECARPNERDDGDPLRPDNKTAISRVAGQTARLRSRGGEFGLPLGCLLMLSNLMSLPMGSYAACRHRGLNSTSHALSSVTHHGQRYDEFEPRA